MRRFLFVCWLAVISAAPLLAAEPTTMWPYLFDDFAQATIYSRSGEKADAMVNIHLLHNDLHYLKGSQIYNPKNQNDVSRVAFAGGAVFVRCENLFVEVLGETPHALLGRCTTGDFDRMLQGTGAYGTSSSTSAVDRLSSLQLGGITNLNYDLLRVDRENGKTLPVTERLYFVVDGRLVKANKKAVAQLLPDSEQKEFDAFVKQSKVKWNKAESLQAVLEYISTRLTR